MTRKKNGCCQLNVLDKEESKLTNPVFEEKLKNNLTTQFGHLQNLYPIRDGFTREQSMIHKQSLEPGRKLSRKLHEFYFAQAKH